MSRKLKNTPRAEAPDLDGFLERSPVPSLEKLFDPKTAHDGFSPGDRIGDFEILSQLGRGGLATVYLARQLSLEREVALKISDNFGREARILATLEHDNIVKVFSESVETDRNLRLICMQYVEGKTLADLIDIVGVQKEIPNGATILRLLSPGPREENEVTHSEESPLLELDFTQSALWIGLHLANALSYAHAKGVLHLDVKPSNVLLNRNARPFLTDFNVSLDERLNRGAMPLLGGTEDYMAPENRALIRKGAAASQGVDHRADLYSLGVVLGEMLAPAEASVARGNSPRRQTLVLKEVGDIVDPEVIYRWQGIDLSLRLVLEKCVTQDPEKRFRSAARLAEALEGCLELRGIAKALPQPSALFAAGTQHPLTSLTLLLFLPMLACSISNQISLHLTVGGGSSPISILGTILLFGILGAAWSVVLEPLRDRLDDLGDALEDPKQSAGARRLLLELPTRIFALMTFIWLPGTLLISASSYHALDGATAATWAKLLLYTALHGMTATGFATLYALLFALRAVYPRFWLGTPRIRQTAERELAGVEGRLRFHYLLMITGPLATASLLFVDPAQAEEPAQIFVSAVLVMGLVGARLAFAMSHRIAQAIFAFSSRRK